VVRLQFVELDAPKRVVRRMVQDVDAHRLLVAAARVDARVAGNDCFQPVLQPASHCQLAKRDLQAALAVGLIDPQLARDLGAGLAEQVLSLPVAIDDAQVDGGFPPVEHNLPAVLAGAALDAVADAALTVSSATLVAIGLG
jgi:hypothetical protein